MMGRTSWANRDFLLVNLPFIGIFQHKNLWPWSLWLCSTVPDCTAGLRKTFPDCNLEIINHWFIYFLSLLMSKMHTAESYQISRFDTELEKWIYFSRRGWISRLFRTVKTKRHNRCGECLKAREFKEIPANVMTVTRECIKPITNQRVIKQTLELFYIYFLGILNNSYSRNQRSCPQKWFPLLNWLTIHLRPLTWHLG